MDSKSKEFEDLLKKLRENIIPMFEQIIVNDNILFPNPHIVKCWKVLDCKTTECSLYGDETDYVRCWQIAGTYCGGKAQGTFVQKYGKCTNCKVFKDSCPTIAEEIGEHFNNMVFLLNKQKFEMIENKQQIEHLNQELISALEQLDIRNREIQEIMVTDKLTGLYNRHQLITILEDEIARCSRYGRTLAIMIMDIDNFKNFNDAYGHLAGDMMLSFIGKLITENIRKTDRAFRYGGEEFVVLLPETDLTMGYIVAERIRKAFKQKSFSVTVKKSKSKGTDSRTVSIGVAQTTGDIGIEELLGRADKSLYLAKEKGRNMTVRDDENVQ